MILGGELDDLPEQAFYLVGNIDDVVEKAAKLYSIKIKFLENLIKSYESVKQNPGQGKQVSLNLETLTRTLSFELFKRTEEKQR